MSKVSKAQAGITLVELMIGMTIGLVVTGAVFTVVLSNQKTILSNNALNQTQESLRFSTTTINRLIRQASSFRKPSVESELIINFSSKQRDCIGKPDNSEENILKLIDGKLICELKELLSGETKQYVLANNVHALSFKYGFVENGLVNYVAFNDISLNEKWNLVTTIKTKISFGLNGSLSNQMIEFITTSHNRSLQEAGTTNIPDPSKDDLENEDDLENNTPSEGTELTLNEIMEMLNVQISGASSKTWSYYHYHTQRTVPIKNNQTITITFDEANKDSLSKWKINGQKIAGKLTFNGPKGNVDTIELTLTGGEKPSVLKFDKKES